MSLVKSKKIANKKSSKSLARFILMLLISFVSILTFSACDWTNDPDTPESNFDKDGNLRIQAPYIHFNPETKSAYDDTSIIDDVSGSFTWELAYFVNDGTKDVNYDQTYYLENYYTDSKYENIYNYYDHSNGIKPKYFSTSADAVEHFGISNVEGSGSGFYAIDQSDPIGTKLIKVYTPAEKIINGNKSISFPSFEVVVDGKYYTFKVTLHPYYLGKKIYEETPFVDNSFDYDKREFKEIDAEGNPVKSLFSFSYRVGKASTGAGDFLPCPDGFMTYYIDEDNKFMIRFNPRLEEGSTNRYIKVKALTETDNGRTSSLYSNTASYEAYTMTFSAYSPNSTSVDYGSLIYDESDYYFHTVKKVYNNRTKENDISSMVGVFPEGRRVIVSRQIEFADDYDYALQSWTMNTKAENSISIANAFPSTTIEDSKFSMLEYVATGTVDDYYKDLLRITTSDSCIPNAKKTGSEAFAEVENFYKSTVCTQCSGTGIDASSASCENCGGKGYAYPKAPTFNYYTKGQITELNTPSKYVKDTIYNMFDNTDKIVAVRSDLAVVSHNKVNGYKFYANFAKVRNFSLSGTFFAGDNFFNGGNQYLTDVTVSVFDKKGNRLCISNVNRTFNIIQLNVNEDKDGNGEPDATGDKLSSVYRVNDISFIFDGSYFTVTGLEIGDYLMFEKVGAPLLDDPIFDDATNLPYGFHSTQMVRLDIASIGINTKVLCVKETDDLYTDRQDIGIIGTQYAEESSLMVNLYQVDDLTGEKTEVEGGIKLLSEGNVSYEVIKSVSSYEDKYGYITTNIIISILLPSNATLVGYNAETVNDNQAVYYSLGNKNNEPTFILKRTYDKLKQEYSMNFEKDLYSFYTVPVNETEVTTVTAGTFVLYNGDTYSYSHNTTSDLPSGLTTTSFYNRLNEPNENEYQVLAKVVTGSSTRWELIKYTKVDASRITGDMMEDGTGASQIKFPVFCVDGDRLYQYEGKNEIASGEANEVSTVVGVYKTEMVQSTADGTNNIYAYYDVKQAHEKVYYTSPIAKEHYVESDKPGEEGLITVDIAYYFAEITNFDSLKSAGKIMLGSQILAGSTTLARQFREVLGAKIVQSCYYYIEPIGETINGKAHQPITVLAKQYLQTIQGVGQQQVNTTYYYNDGGLKVFAGSINGADLIANDTVFAAYNMNGAVIDLEKYSNISRGEMFDASGILNYDVGYNVILGAHNYMSSHTIVETDTLGPENQKPGFMFVENTEQTINGLKIRYAYTLYELNPDGTISSTALYYNADEGNFYRILDTYPISYPIVIDEIETIETKTICEVEENTGFKIEVKNSSGNLLDRFRVTKIAGTSTVKTYTQEEKVGTSVVTKTYTTYEAFLVPSFYVTNQDGNTETQIYNMVSDGSTQSVPCTFAVSSNPVFKYTGTLASGASVSLIPEITTTSVASNETALVRTAQIANTNTQVTMLGKYIQTGDSSEPIVYPSFSNLNKWSLDEAFILKGNGSTQADMFDHYYELDYTSKKLVIEGFPGVRLLAGAPYPNPVIYLSVRHKKTEDAVVNLSFDIKNAYFVEIMGTQIKTEDSNLIRDFTTYAFKDTVTNLSLNDYIDKSYWILDAVTLKPVIPYIYKDGKYQPKLVDEDDNPIELSIQDVGLNEDSVELFYSDTISATGIYKEKIYMQYVKNDGSIGYKTINYEEDVILWRTDATMVERVPMYDIHSYTQGKDGIIYFDSGTDTDDNVLCIGLEGISSGATQQEDSMFNYDKVLVSGVTSAYRTKTTELNISDSMYYGYWFDKGLNVMNAYDSNDAYFLSGKESVVIMASPTVQVNAENGDNYIYRFKEWQIYSRYNSEVMYYNRGLTENLIDRENAILRFSSNEAGYFVILPVYQRVYKIDLGTAVIDGAINQGGDISVLYSGGADVDVENATKEELYLIEYFKTEFNNQEGYYYSNILGAPYLWFTGELDRDTSMPIFEKKENIYAIRYNQTYKRFLSTHSTGDIILYFELLMSGDYVTGVKPVRVLSNIAVGYPGLVPIVNDNGQYHICGTAYIESFDEFRFKTGTAVDEIGQTYSTSEPMRLKDLVCHTFTGEFFYDSILSETTDNSVSIVVHYDEDSKRFSGLDLTTLNSRVENALKARDKWFFTPVKSLLEYVLYWNMIYNSHIFSDAQVFEKIGKKYDGNYLDNPDLEQLTFSSFNLNNSLTEPIARSVTNYHTVMFKYSDDIMVGEDFYRSTYASLDGGELAYDEEGNLYSAIQFKTAYIDRDTTVKLVASSGHGYRVEGWYQCIYDEEAGVWYTTDEKVKNSDNVYGDEILLAEYNETLKTYFYITQYFEERGVGKIYYFDEEKTEEAEVPQRMLDKVRGYFVNQGTETNPNWIQVYKKGNGDETAYYYDRQFSRLVDLQVYKVEEKSFYEAIRKVVDGENTHYTLNNITIYRKTDEEGNNEQFFRTMSTGNIVVDGNTLIINKLHSNLRYVAKFIEVYTEYIFAEPPEASGIEVKAVYYTTTDNEKVERDGEFTIIRTDLEGHNLTGEYHADFNAHGIDESVTGLDENFFNLYEQEEAKTAVAKAGKTGNLTPQIMRTTVTNPNTGKTFTKYTADSYTNYSKLLSGDFGSDNKAYLVNAEKDELLKGELTLRNMYFDVHTDVYIVVGVKSDAELTVHSLGFSPSYNIEPIIEPSEEFINHNQSADADEKYDYLYYMFKISYDRNPQNPLAPYEVHSKRYTSIASDVLAGNYTEFYQNHFDIYDNFGNRINYQSIANTENNTGRKVRLSSYLQTLRNKKIISNEIYAKYSSEIFDNVRDCLEAVSREAKNPGLLYVDYAIAKNGEVDEEGNAIILRSADDIFRAVRDIKVKDPDDPDKMIYYFKTPRLIRTGSQNTVNLSSIPIYSYTIQAVTVDDYTYDKSGNLVFTEPEEVEVPKDLEEGEEVPDPEEPRLILNNSKKHFLKNTIYTAAGTNKYTYLGYGDLFELPTPLIYVDDKYSENVELHFKDSYINLEYGEENEDKTILADLPIAANTIMLLEGADMAQEGYAFVGWFEQKYNKKSNVCLYKDQYNCTCSPDVECECEDHECEFGKEGWSELTLMSNELEHPYLTLSTADTVIVAVYKKVVDVSITYDNREMNIELPTGNMDSLGKDVLITVDDTKHTTTISGKFYFDTYQQFIVSPVGGYRFDGFEYQVSKDGEWSAVYTTGYDDKHIHYIDRNNEVKDHYDISLNSVIGVSYAMSECIVECEKHKDPYEKVRITIKAKKITLVHIEVENFYAFNEGEYTFSGWNFALYDIGLQHGSEPQLIVKTINSEDQEKIEVLLEYNDQVREGKSGEKSFHHYYVKDSAGNLVQGNIDQGTLKLYGYFDVEMSGNLLLVAFDGSSVIRKWYINGHPNTTDTYENLSSYGIPEQRKSFAAQFDAAFNIHFHYPESIDNGKGSTIDYNTNNYFALDKDNDVYYARAVIEAASSVTITHTFIESIEGDGATRVGVEAGTGSYSSVQAYSILAYNGSFSYIDGAGNMVTENNGTFAVKNKGEYKFSEDTTLNISVQAEFITIDGKLYKFLGWFDSYGTAGSASSYIISREMSLSAMEPKGVYEAKYVRVHRVELDYNAFGQIEVDPYNEIEALSPDYNQNVPTEVFGYYDGGHYYIMSGAELIINAYATEGYVLPDFTVTPLEDAPGELKHETEDNIDYLKLTVHEVDRAVRVSANFDEGYDITINQMLHSSVDMAQDAEYLSTVYSYITYRDRELKTTRYAVPKNSTVKFSVKGEEAEENEFPEYFFLGWYIDDVLMSRDITSGAILYDYEHTLTKDLVIEARFVPYVNVVVSSRVVGINTTVNKFAYTMTYKDLRTNTECTYSKTTQISLPMGLVVNLVANDENVSNAYEFVGWKMMQGTTVLKTFASEKDANITLSSDLIQNDKIYIYALYGRKTTLNLYKNITIREEDRATYLVNGELSDEFMSMFDLVVEYIDIFGNTKTIRLGANESILDISASQYTSVKIKYEMSNVVADRYYLDNILVKSSGNTKYTYTATYFEDQEWQTVSLSSNVSMNITATFKPSSAITIATELNGTKQDIFSSRNDVVYEFGTGDSAIKGTVDNGSKAIKVPAISQFTVTATSPAYGNGGEIYYKFVGWYNGGTLITTDLVLTEAKASGKIVFGTNINLTARYVAVVNNITINRVFDGSTPDIEKANALEVSATANFYRNNINTGTGDIKLFTLAIEDGKTSAQDELIVANQKVILIATHLAGYDFVGFEVVQGELLDDGAYVTNSFNTVKHITPAPCQSLVINAIYKEKTYSVNYVVTSYNSTSNEGGAISNYTEYVGPSETSISFAISNASFKAYINGNAVSHYSTGGTYTIAIPSSCRNCDLTVELRYIASESYSTINAGSGKSWFVKDAHEEMYAISHMSNLKILSSDYAKLNLVSAKDPYSGTLFNTTYRIDYYDGNTTNPVSSSAVTTNKPTDKIIVGADNKKYVFEGYWARIGTASSYTFIKVGSTIDANVGGYWSNIIAKYRRVEEVNLTPSVKGASHTVSYVRTPFAINPTYVNTAIGDGSQSTYYAFVSGSNLTLSVNPKTALDISTKKATYVLVDGITTSYSSRIDSIIDSYTLARNNVQTTINLLGTKINGAVCSISANTGKTAIPRTASTNGVGDSVAINPINEEINLSLSINVTGAEEVDRISTMYVNIYSTDGTYYEPLAITKATGITTITVKTGSTISLSYSIGDHKQFLYYSIAGVQYKDITYNYTIADGYGSNITIVGYFTGKYTASIEENDTTKGVASLMQTTSTSSTYNLSITNKDSFMISGIYFATVESGNDGTYDYSPLFLNSLHLSYSNKQLSSISGMVSSVSYTFIKSSPDDDSKTYNTALTLRFTALDNVVIKIEYMHVTKLIIEVKEKNAVQGQYTFYLSEFADPELKVADELTLEKLKARIDGISSATLRDALVYLPEDLCTFSFEGNTFDDTVSINHTKRDNVLVTLNRLTQVEVTVYIIMNFEKTDGGANLYNTPKEGLQISYDDTTVAKYNSSTKFTYVSAKSKPIVAEDTNGFFKFDGYYVGDDKEEDLQISSSSDYVLLSTDFGGTKFKKQADGSYAVYAIFTESLLTITIDADFGNNQASFAISQTDTEDGYKNFTETKQTLSFVNASGEDIGNLTYFFNTETEQYEMTYPASLVKNSTQIYIKAIDFDEEVTDDVYITEVLSAQGITKFYQKTIKTEGNSVDNEYYRFYRFVDAGGLMVGNLYTNFTAVDLGGYETGTSLTAETKELYMIEYTYNYLPDLFYIDMTMTVLKGSTLSTITIGTTQGQSYKEFDKALIRYLAEKDMNITVGTHFLPGYDYALYADFESIVYSKSVMISDILLKEGNEYVLGENGVPGTPTKLHNKDNVAPCGYYIDTAKEYWDTLLNEGVTGVYTAKFLPVANYYKSENAYSKFESFNFLAKENTSFVADFYNIAQNIKYFIFSILSNYDYDGFVNNEFKTSGHDFKVSFSSGKMGLGYFFTITAANTDYEITTQAPLTKDLDSGKTRNYAQDFFDDEASIKAEDDSSLVKITPYFKNSPFDERIRAELQYKGTTHAITTDKSASDLQYSQTNIHMMISNVAYLDFSALKLIKHYQEEGILYGSNGMPEKETKDALSYYVEGDIPTYKNYNDYIVKYEQKPYAYSGIGYKVKAEIIEGYYFKGFIMVSSGYDATYDLMGFGGETVRPTGKTFTYIPHKMNTDIDEDGNEYYTSAETVDFFTLEYATKIYALYEARVYVINVSTFEFKEDNEKLYAEHNSGEQKGEIDNEKSMMTTLDVESSIIKGSLIVEHGEDAKLTSQNLLFMQFVGWATTKEFDNDSLSYDDKFKVAFDTGLGLKGNYDLHVDEEHLTTLKYNDVKVGYYDKDGAYHGDIQGYNVEKDEFAVSTARNNIYIYDMNRDIDIIAYYTYISYRITINLADIIPTYYYADKYATDLRGTTTYLTYPDYIRETPGWTNPSAGTYNQSWDWGTNELNEREFTSSVYIDSHDPYVYTYVDNEGNALTYPTKIQYSLIDISKSQQTGNLVYKKISKSGTYQNVLCAKKYGAGTPLPYYDRAEDIKKYLDVDTLDGYNFDQVYRNGYSYNQAEYVTTNTAGKIKLDENGKLIPKLNNIFNYVNINKVGTTTVATVKDNLFEITVDGEKVPVSDFIDVEIDTALGTVKFDIKVRASKTGLPDVKITMNKKTGINGVTAHTIEVTKSNDHTVKRGPTISTTVKGFNLEAFSNSDFMTDPNYELPDLDVGLILKWQEKAIAIDTTVKISGKEVHLSGEQSLKADLSSLKCQTHKYCSKCKGLKNAATCQDYEIMAYFIVVVENGLYYQYLLEDLLGNSKLTKKDKENLNNYIAAFLGETPGNTTDTGAVYNVADRSTGNFLDSDTRKGILSILNKYYDNRFAGISHNDILKYKVYDTFHNFREGVNINFYPVIMNTQDMILNMPLLQEHARGQHNNWPENWKFPLTGDKGFNYYRNAHTGYHSNIDTGLMKFVSYENYNCTPDDNKDKVGLWKKFTNYVTGIYNGAKKYAATYHRLLHSMLVLDSSINMDRLVTLGASLTITVNTSPEQDTKSIILSGLHDWEVIPIQNAAHAFWEITTGGIAVTLIKFIIVKCVDSEASLFDKIANQNHWGMY